MKEKEKNISRDIKASPSSGHWIRYLFTYIGFVILMAGLIFILILIMRRMSEKNYTSSAATPVSTEFTTVILDAGHGGEDGGAIGQLGEQEIFEKDINLAICKMLRDLLEQNGISVIMTREEDILLYNRNVDFHGRKKLLDLEARLQIGKQTPGAIFVSVHMNAFPQQQYHGLQVYYSPNHPLSHVLAENVQDLTRSLLQPDNHRKVKAATSSIYLLHRLECPAILAECGFLSNREECASLATKEYQQQIALLLFSAICQSMAE